MRRRIGQPKAIKSKKNVGKRENAANLLSERQSERSTTASTQRMRPQFCFEYLQSGYCIPSCEPKHKISLADTLWKLSRLTWQDITQAPRHGSGCEKIAQKSIKAPLPRFITPDVQLLSFRFCGMAPMVGYRENQIFHVIWLDKKFDLYDHG